MKRSRFGFGLLLFLLVLGAASALWMVKVMEPMSDAMEQAGNAALRQDWTRAEAAFGDVRQDWDRRFPLFAALTDHEPMENINGLFAQLEVYSACRDPQGFAALCAQLARDLEAMGEAHSLTWWNVF